MTPDRLAELTKVRAEDPGAIGRAAAARQTRPLVRGDGRLLIVAADHPARGVLSIGSDAMAMGDRGDLLDRLMTALSDSRVDGVLGTPDIIDDLLLLGALDDRIAIGSMNRGGLPGSAYEFDDRFTGYDAPAIARDNLDGGKLLIRINPRDAATISTLESSAHAVTSLAAHQRMAMVEPFMVGDDGRNDLSAEAVVRSVAIASALGTTSAHTWLKIPVIEDMARVARATTLPLLLLGGESKGADTDAMFAAWANALAQPAVRGLVVGRNLLYPADGDVAGAVATAAGLLGR
jgi:DhnA family fructose-bisphosphate aldolase class Ia